MDNLQKLFQINHSFSVSKLLLLLTILSLPILAKCTPNPSPTVTSSPSALPGTVTPPQVSPSATKDITPTPLPGRVVLVAPANIEQGWFDETHNLLKDLSLSSGLILEVQQSLKASEIKQDWKLVIFMSAPSDLDQIIQAAPRVQFLVMTPTLLAPAVNLSVIRLYPERLAFLAGYVSVLIAPDWRAAALLPSDGPLGATLQQAYLNGGAYYCGRCPSVLTPIVLFPLVSALPVNSTSSSWQATADNLVSTNIIYVLYVAPEAAKPDILQHLVESKVVLIGSQSPSKDLMANWAATLHQDTSTPLKTLWESLLNGQEGKSADASLSLTDINPEFLTPGRQRLVDKLIEDLGRGWVSPLTP